MKKNKSVIVFTDIKEFTLKSSLLGVKGITQILDKQDAIIIPLVEEYNGSIIKTIGDAFMIVFGNAQDAIKCMIEVQKKFKLYNQTINDEIYKIKLKISLDEGELIQRETIKGEDFFGEAVNISSRLENITPEEKIFITEKIFEEIKNENEFKISPLGEKEFQGILHSIKIFEVLY
ncbi:adenylate/guanylate cyclase domain-containing protein [Candidatus Gracilibacteria bacterium]|nr:adenylate/guanylate cyclase domain-containing protein [Candidatus Gracilibacteria bacterium]NUJ99157.1 adenylate/guanylate cyclase domain-containing protein [Candidatus Gracilibacteria bacterium]